MSETSQRSVQKSANRSARIWAWRAWCAIRIVLVFYLLAILMLLWLETKLMFPGPKYPVGDWSPDLPIEDVYFETSDGVKLNGWLLEHPEPRGYVIFSHGNGANLGYLPNMMQLYRDQFQVTIFAYDYRGYGRSEGKPTGDGVILDGRAAHAWFTNRVEQPANEIIPVGRSLGGAIAVDLAVLHQSKALVVQRSFNNIPDVAASHYPIIPVRRLMRTRLNSAERIAEYHGPLLQSHGDADQVVPIRFGRKLHEACPSEDKRFHLTPDGGHNTPTTDEYWSELGQFFERVL